MKISGGRYPTFFRASHPNHSFPIIGETTTKDNVLCRLQILQDYH